MDELLFSPSSVALNSIIHLESKKKPAQGRFLFYRNLFTGILDIRLRSYHRSESRRKFAQNTTFFRKNTTLEALTFLTTIHRFARNNMSSQCPS